MSSKKKAKDLIAERAKALSQLQNLVPKRTSLSSMRSSLSNDTVLRPSEVFIKEEPTTDSPSVKTKTRRTVPNIYYCRCCFKFIDHSQATLPNPDKVVKTLEEMIHRPLEYSPNTPNFCVDCYNFIGSFKQFRNLAIARQEKFKKMLANNTEDYSEIFYIDAGTEVSLFDSFSEQDIFEQIESNSSSDEDNSDDSFDSLPSSLKKKRRSHQKQQKSRRSSSPIQMDVKVPRKIFESVFNFDEREFLGRSRAKWPIFNNCIMEGMDLPEGRINNHGAKIGNRETFIRLKLREDGHKTRCGKNYRLQTKTENIFSEDPITFSLRYVSTKCFCSKPSFPEKEEQSLKRQKCEDSDDEKD